MAEKLDIIFISDVACPWCLVGLRNMEAALDELAGEIEAQIRFAPFELNPTCRPKASIAAPILPKNTGCPRRGQSAR